MSEVATEKERKKERKTDQTWRAPSPRLPPSEVGDCHLPFFLSFFSFGGEIRILEFGSFLSFFSFSGELQILEIASFLSFFSFGGELRILEIASLHWW
jgi:hypothetical protein